MRRLAIPLVLVLVATLAAWQTTRSDAAADDPPPVAGPIGPVTSTPVLSARRVPGFVRTPASDALLATELGVIAASAPASTCFVVREGDREIYAFNPDLPLVPASTTKLLTAAGAYGALGPDHRFVTAVRASVPVVDGVLDGNLWLVGGGDPVLDTDGYVGRFADAPPSTDVESLADQIAEAGVTRVTGGIVGDESRYDTERYGANWPVRFTGAAQNQTGPLSALMIDDALVSYPADPAARSQAVASAEPAVHAADVLRVLLGLRGVVVEGASSVGVTPGDATVTLASVESPPLAEIVSAMLDDSDNTTAELLVKEVGHDATGTTGTTAGGLGAIVERLTADGLDPMGLVLDDGSGLSELNRITCGQLVGILGRAGPDSRLADGLSVAGETGTLAPIYAGTELEGLIRAKTGSLNDVRALAGFAEGVEGDVITFALIVNADTIAGDAVALGVQDVLGRSLVGYPSGPSLAEVTPP